MKSWYVSLKSAISSIKKYSSLIALLFAMFVIHRYIFLYADDFYFSRDASYGLSYFPYFVQKQLNAHGRVWIHILLWSTLKYGVSLFRIINPLVITLSAALISAISIDAIGDNSKFLYGSTIASALFLLLPLKIAHTTIYYAACSFNYLYTSGITLLYGYLLYRHWKKGDLKTRWHIVLLAFFAGSSTEQTGMIAIGFTVLVFLYYRIFEKKKIGKRLLPCFCAVFLGYGVVTYGAVKRLLLEQSKGREANIAEAIANLLTINIFSTPAAGYVLFTILGMVFWLLYYSHNDKPGAISLHNKLTAAILSLMAFGFVYIALYRKHDAGIFLTPGSSSLLRIFFIAFAAVYIISLVYVSYLIMIYEKYPFILFCTINAIGAQVMLVAADPRFAGAYKIMFPSLLLMSIFMVFTFINFYDSIIFLSLTLLSFSLGHIRSSRVILLLTALSVGLTLLFLIFKRLSFDSVLAKISAWTAFTVLTMSVFYQNYMGYKNISYFHDYNLAAIREYHKLSDKSILKLKRVPPTLYGYNVNNWNTMPYFMRECYRIDKSTVIEYLDSP